jgi:3-methyladenine DNA glycosylase AlkC
MTEIKRKGARSIKDIPKNILEQLNNGTLESVNLVEWLAVNQKLLLENVLIQTNRKAYIAPVLKAIALLKKQTVNTVNEAIGTELLLLTMAKKDIAFLETISKHPSDTVRCWATYTIARNETLDIGQILQLIQPFAADKHFGVREIAWLSVRPSIAKNLKKSMSLLSKWTTHSDENVRRFASESTRPRGVWCEHIDELKQNPTVALSILEPLKSDAAKYVQDSVGNWLNDASKTQPEFVMALCKKWEKESKTKETAYIIKKALRTIEK